MKVGDTVIEVGKRGWNRIGLILEFSGGMVLVFWGDDFPCEPEYPEHLEVI